MKNTKFSRFLACLLAALMLSQTVGFAPSVFAADEDVTPPFLDENGSVETQDPIAPVLVAKSDEVLIKSTMSNEEVSELLSKALISNYDELDDATKASLKWEYYCTGRNGLLKNDDWGSIDGFTTDNGKSGIFKVTYTHPSLAKNSDGNYQVRLAGTDNAVTLVKVSAYTTSVVLKENASITYNMDGSAEKTEIVNNVIDYERSNLPAGTDAADFTVERKGSILGVEVGWKDIADNTLDAGDGQKIQITFNGKGDYAKSGKAEGTVNVAKANVNVSVTPVSKLYAGEEINPETFYSLDPNDDAIDVYILFVGVNTNLESCVNLKLTPKTEKVIDGISAAQEKLNPGSETLKDQLRKGMKLGELRAKVNEVIAAADNKLVQATLELFGVDVDALRSLLDALNAIGSLTDDTIIALYTPAHAGVYQAYAVAVNKNYNTAVGSGTLIILKNWKGIKLEIGPEFSSNGSKNTITVSQAKDMVNGKTHAVLLTKDGNALNETSQEAVHYWFTGVNKIYVGSKMPTEPGRYIVTASVRGGDFFALPKTFSFTIVADPAPEA